MAHSPLEYVKAQTKAAYDGMALADDDRWPYCLNTREAGVVVAALRAYADRPGEPGRLADELHEHLQRHIAATLAGPCP